MKGLKTLSILLSAFVLIGCTSHKPRKIHHFEELAGEKIAVQRGTSFEDMLKAKYPDFDILSVPTSFDIFEAVISGTATYGVEEDISVIRMMANGIRLDTSHIEMPPEPMGAIFNKNNAALQRQFNDFIDSLDRCGALNEMREKWFTALLPTSLPVPESKYTEGEPLTAFNEGDYPPFSLKVGSMMSGLDIEIMTLFANRLRRPLKVSVINFDDIIPYIAEGKADMAMSGISITDERAQKVLFSIPYNHTYTTIFFSKRLSEF